MGKILRRTLTLLAWGLAVLAGFAAAAQSGERPYLTLYANEAGESDSPRNQYLRLVRVRIEENRHYPLPARKQGMEGRAGVRFAIGKDGVPTGIELVAPCRHRLLNEAALSAVRKAGPFPAPPAGVFTGQVALTVELVFTLD
ncbi:MAG: TonB family protein [Thermodesulfobacteriota bacterium]